MPHCQSATLCFLQEKCEKKNQYCFWEGLLVNIYTIAGEADLNTLLYIMCVILFLQATYYRQVPHGRPMPGSIRSPYGRLEALPTLEAWLNGFCVEWR